MILCLEEQGLLPVPIFINGIEAHTIVRDQLTSAHEMAHGSPPEGAVAVDAIVNSTSLCTPRTIARVPPRALGR